MENVKAPKRVKKKLKLGQMMNVTYFLIERDNRKIIYSFYTFLLSIQVETFRSTWT